MKGTITERLRNLELFDRIVTAEEAASWIEDGMSLGLSGFTRCGDAKAVPLALVERSKDEKFKVNVYTGASLGFDVDKLMAEAGIINKRLPFQAEPAMRKKINAGEMLYTDNHLSQVAELLYTDVLDEIDYAIIEATSITEDGTIIFTTSVGNNPIFLEKAKNVIIELNLAQPIALEGVHDNYLVGPHGNRQPIPITKTNDRVGTLGVKVDPAKIKGIVITEYLDSPSSIVPPDEETNIMANHLLQFIRDEIAKGRLTQELPPLQSGVGSVANAVLHGLLDSEFENLEFYSEVLQDAVFDLIDRGKIKFASGCSFTLSESKRDIVLENLDKYRDKLMLRPQEISNHPEVIRRLGLIAINTAIEVDIYGNVNSTHITGTKMMNGIGGSGDFARNSRISIFVTKSIAKGGNISSIVPFASHIDHTEHDVDVIVTEQGYADLRGLAPTERAIKIIENCAHPMYREQLLAYFEEAKQKGGQTPHNLEKALSWHTNLIKNGTMLEKPVELPQNKDLVTH